MSLLPLWCGLVACGDSAGESTPDAAVGEGLFVEGCPEPGVAVARQLAHPDARMHGPDAIGGVGDTLLMNEHAAYVIQSPDAIKSYYHYGGILIDAVALDGCAQAGAERFEEAGLMLARANLGNFEHSIVRAFRGDTVEIISDGSDGGEARVRVRGSDDTYWLVEYELIKGAFLAGDPKPPSQPFGLDITVDYVLLPDSPVLTIEFQLTNIRDESTDLITATILSFGDTSDPTYYARYNQSIGGFHLQFGMPWIVADSGDGAWAFTLADANMATTNIQGVDAVLDLDQMFDPVYLGAAGRDDDTQMVTYYFSVGNRDINSAVRHLQPYDPEAIPDLPHTLHPFSGQVTASESGTGLAGALVDIQLSGSGGQWMTVDGFITDETGGYGGEIPNFGNDTLEYRLVVSAPGRPAAAPQSFYLPQSPGIDVALDPGGTLRHDIRDGDGTPIPAKILLWSGSSIAHRIYTVGAPGDVVVPPGSYEVTVTRGFEYDSYESTLEIVASGTTPLTVTLAHEVDTSGFLSMDGHIHAGPSPDSRILVPDRIRTAAAEGLDVVVSTDHESVSDWGSGVSENGLEDWVVTVIGQEVTASLPEHTNMYPVERDPTDTRGGFVRWFGLDLAEIFAAERARGAGVVALNHPRNGCNYLCIIGYDRLTGQPTLSDPTLLGLDAGAELWTWDFDTVELMNGNSGVFVDPAYPDSSGTFEDWMSFLNLGHRVTATAVTDTHGWGGAGDPRTYFSSSTDAPGELDEQELIDAMHQGRAVASSGAFARVEVNASAGLGDTVTDTDGSVDLAVHIEAASLIDVTHFMVFVNCDEATKIAATDANGIVKYDGVVPIDVDVDAHLVVLGFGAGSMPRGLDQYNPARIPRFTTNAIYVDADGNGVYDPPGGKTCSYTLGAP